MDFYDVLDIPKTFTKEDLQKNFTKKVKEFHPDNKKTGNSEKFEKVKEAYDVLSNPDKRKLYDDGLYNKSNGDYETDFTDIFNNIFNFGMPFSTQKTGFEDIFSAFKTHRSTHIMSNVSVKEFYTKSEKYIEYDKETICNCSQKKCNLCNSTGIINKIIDQGPMRMIRQLKCTECLCSKCNGTKFITKKDKIKVNLADSVYLDTILIKNEETKQDLLIKFNVLEHENWSWNHRNKCLFCKIDININELLFGIENKTIELLNGKIIKISLNKFKYDEPKNIGNEYGMEFKDENGKTQKSDIYLSFNIVLPKNIKKLDKLKQEKLKNLLNISYE